MVGMAWLGRMLGTAGMLGVVGELLGTVEIHKIES